MAPLNYSLSLVGGANENVNDLNTLLAEIRASVNSVDNDQVATGAGIEFSKLQALASGRLLIGDGSAAVAKAMSGDATIDSDGVLTIGAEKVGGVELADDVLGVYQELMGASGMVPPMGSNTHYPLGNGAQWGDGLDMDEEPPTVYLDDADVTVAGRTAKLRLRAHVFIDDAINRDLLFGLYRLTGMSTVDGSILVDSTAAVEVTVPEPTPGTIGTAVSSEISYPTDGLYVFGVETATGAASSAYCHVQAQLQRRFV